MGVSRLNIHGLASIYVRALYPHLQRFVVGSRVAYEGSKMAEKNKTKQKGFAFAKLCGRSIQKFRIFPSPHAVEDDITNYKNDSLIYTFYFHKLTPSAWP